MLGAMVVDVFASARDFAVTATARATEQVQQCAALYPEIEWILLDASSGLDRTAQAVAGAKWVINCIGIIKPYIHDNDAVEIQRALRVNSVFPHELGAAAASAGARLLQIATDCVFSGSEGPYSERRPHDALDVYGKTKSLGEPYVDGTHSLRCSIIGPEPKHPVSLLEWFLAQKRNAEVKGFTNHLWNGLTTLHFARVCLGIVSKDLSLPRLQHLIPADTVSKADLLDCFRRSFHREDVRVTRVESGTKVDRVLSTEQKETNSAIWRAAGYSSPPGIADMVSELSEGTYRFRSTER